MRGIWNVSVVVLLVLGACTTEVKLVVEFSNRPDLAEGEAWRFHVWATDIAGICSTLNSLGPLELQPEIDRLGAFEIYWEGHESWPGLNIGPNQSVVVEMLDGDGCRAWVGCQQRNEMPGDTMVVQINEESRMRCGGSCRPCPNLADGGADAGLDAAGDLAVPDAGDDQGLFDGGPDASPPSIPLDTCTSPVMLRVATGTQHTCAIDARHRIFCWGANEFGQTEPGAPRPGTVIFPVEVLTGETVGADDIGVGRDHSCTLLLDGRVRCWGNSGGDQHRLGSAAAGPGPTELAQLYTELSVGLLHSCAIHTNGQVWCWGQNASGELGRGSMLDTTAYETPGPARDGDGEPIVRQHVIAGAGTTCAWNDDGASLICWGFNSRRALGFSGTGPFAPQHLSILEGGSEVTSLQTIGMTHSDFVGSCGAPNFSGNSCAVGDGGVFCWGSNPCYGVGNETNEVQRTPVEVSGGLLWVAPRTDRVNDWHLAVGGGTTCVRRFTIDTDRHDMFCWGDNSVSQLLVDVGSHSPTTPILFHHDIIDMDVGGGHVCVVTEGRVFCWGNNSRGQADPRGFPTTEVSTPHCVTIEG